MTKSSRRKLSKLLMIMEEIIKLNAYIIKSRKDLYTTIFLQPFITNQQFKIDNIKQTPAKCFKPGGGIDKRRYKRFVTNRFKNSITIYPYMGT